MGRPVPLFLTPVSLPSATGGRGACSALRSSRPFRGSAVFAQRRCNNAAIVLQSADNRALRKAHSPVQAAADAVECVVFDTQVAVRCGGETAEVKLLVENLGGRRRRISGGVDIDASAQRVWNVLTRYECNEQYMPNIKKSEVERLNSGDILLEQVGVISNKLGLRTRMVMRVKEDFGAFRITFSKAEGRDFVEFEGRYQLLVISPEKVRLEYEITAVPIPIFPVSLVERKISKEVPGMLASVRQEAMEGNFVPF